MLVNFHDRGKLTLLEKFKAFLTRLKGSEISTIDQIGMVFFAAIVISTTLIWLFEERFSKENWKTYSYKRYKMADEIIENKLIIGKTKQEIILLLGDNMRPSKANGKEQFIYPLGTPQSFFEVKEETLIVVFENNKVINVIHRDE